MQIAVRKIFPLIAVLPLFYFCNSEEEKKENQLKKYIDAHPLSVAQSPVLACATGRTTGFLGSQEHPISILFYPIQGSRNFKYFESSSDNIDSKDHSLYTMKELPQEGLMNDYMRRFLREGEKSRVWGIVVYETDDALHVSDPVRLKFADAPTEFSEDKVNINQSPTTTQPLFEWQDGSGENATYFSVIVDESDNFISGVYTARGDRRFQFYDTSNVVLNVSPPLSTPRLNPNQTYTYIMMGVSDDSWVNLLIKKDFRT